MISRGPNSRFDEKPDEARRGGRAEGIHFDSFLRGAVAVNEKASLL